MRITTRAWVLGLGLVLSGCSEANDDESIERRAEALGVGEWETAWGDVTPTGPSVAFKTDARVAATSHKASWMRICAIAVSDGKPRCSTYTPSTWSAWSTVATDNFVPSAGFGLTSVSWRVNSTDFMLLASVKDGHVYTLLSDSNTWVNTNITHTCSGPPGLELSPSENKVFLSCANSDGVNIWSAPAVANSYTGTGWQWVKSIGGGDANTPNIHELGDMSGHGNSYPADAPSSTKRLFYGLEYKANEPMRPYSNSYSAPFPFNGWHGIGPSIGSMQANVSAVQVGDLKQYVVGKIFYVTNVKFHKSTDGGSSWTSANIPGAQPNAHFTGVFYRYGATQQLLHVFGVGGATNDRVILQSYRIQ